LGGVGGGGEGQKKTKPRERERNTEKSGAYMKMTRGGGKEKAKPLVPFSVGKVQKRGMRKR